MTVRAPRPSNSSRDMTTPGWRALRMAVTPTPFSFASCDSGASVASPTPRPSTTMFFQPGSSLKPTPSGPAMLKSSPGAEHRHAAGAASLGLVEEFDLARGLVDAIDAHRPAHPDLGAVGRGTEQVEHLPGIGLQRVLMHLAGSMCLYSSLTAVVGHDVADELAHAAAADSDRRRRPGARSWCSCRSRPCASASRSCTCPLASPAGLTTQVGFIRLAHERNPNSGEPEFGGPSASQDAFCEEDGLPGRARQ